MHELLRGAWALRLARHADARGDFVKTFAAAMLRELGLPFEAREQFMTLSRRDTIRGLHYQAPPHDHVKLVCCLAGQAQDVVVDLRPGPQFGRVANIELDGTQPVLLYLPSGVAHGFRARTDGTLMSYMTSSEHAPSHDRGVHWRSIDHDWGCAAPVLSPRDQAHPPLDMLVSPFATGPAPE
jgi:dTDP-4-dehydrorhamnose 3,5-epimerase/CDP-3, 6-dideoxy-D-glycero-D-glycero-4-hexulose-5-epimerase